MGLSKYGYSFIFRQLLHDIWSVPDFLWGSLWIPHFKWVLTHFLLLTKWKNISSGFLWSSGKINCRAYCFSKLFTNLIKTVFCFSQSILSFCNTGTTWRSSPIVAKQPEKHHCQNSDYLGFVLVSNLKIIWFWGKCTLYKESPKMCSLSHLTGQTASRPVTLLSFSGILFTFLHCITASSGPSSNGLHTTMWCIKQMKKH